MKLSTFYAVLSNRLFRTILVIGFVIGQALPAQAAQASSSLLEVTESSSPASINLTDAVPSEGTGFCSGILAEWTVPATATKPPDKAGGVPTNQNPLVTKAEVTASKGNLTDIFNLGILNGDGYSWRTYGYHSSTPQNIDFTLDTSKFTDISMSFWVDNPGPGNGPTKLELAYNNGGGWNTFPPISSLPGAFTQYTQGFTGLTSTSGNTTFRLTASGAKFDDTKGALLYDDILFTGTRVGPCPPVAAMPTLQKAFQPTTIALNGSTSLRFMLGNANTLPLTGVAFTDVLPAGLAVADGSANACSGTVTTTASTRTISFSGGTIPSSNTCSFNVSVTGAAAGTFTNSTGFITSTESGTNTGSGGYGSASLTVLAPPVIAIQYLPNPIYVGGASTLAFSLTNPNPGVALSGVAFTGTVPTGLAIEDGSAPACSGTLTATASTNAISFSGGTIPAGGSCTMEVSVAGLTAGSYLTTTSAVTSTNGGTGNTASDTLEVQTVNPVITIDKKTNGLDDAGNIPVGSTVNWTYLVSNTGNVPLTSVGVVDDQGVIVTCPQNTLAVGESMTCTASGTATPGTYTNTGTATGTPPVGSNVSASDSSGYFGSAPAISLIKTADPTTYDHVGQTITYSYEIQNTGNVTLPGPFSVSDDHIGTPPGTPFTCGSGPLAPNDTTSCTATYTITQDDLDAGKVTNAATGHASYGGVAVDSNQDTKTVNAIQQGGLGLTKDASPATYDAVNQIITYTYGIKNTGNVTLAGPFTVNDDKAGAVSCPTGSLAPQATVSCTGTYAITQADLDEGSVTNTATATDGTLTSNEAQATVTAEQKPALTLDKSAAESTYAAVGDVLHYSYLVTNSGNVTLQDAIVVSDDQASDESCPAFPEDGLAPGASITCTASYTVTQADLDAGKVTNVASATSGTIPSNTDTVTVTATQTPELSLKKSANPTTYTAAGQTISYSYDLKNTGNVTLSAPFAVTDDKASVACPAEVTSLAPGASVTCTASYTITQTDVDSGSVTNVATATAVFSGDPVTSNQDQATVTAEVTPALSLTKTATPHFSDPVKAGDTIDYTLTATNTDDVTLHDVTISDPLLPSLSCTPAQPATLAPGASLTCTGSYTLAQADIDAGQVANTAYATSKLPGGGAGPGGQDSQTVPVPQGAAIKLAKTVTETKFTRAGDVLHYTLVATNTGNVTLNNVTISAPLLGTLTCTQPATLSPSATLTCTGSYTVQQPDLDAGKVTNTATATGSFGGKDYTASHTDTVIRPVYIIYMPVITQN